MNRPRAPLFPSAPSEPVDADDGQDVLAEAAAPAQRGAAPPDPSDSSDVPGATANRACDTAASTRTVMAPRPSSPSRTSAAPRDSETPQAGKPPTHGGPAPVHASGAANTPQNAPASAGAAQVEPPEPAHLHEPLGPDDPLAPLPFNPYKGNRGIMRAWNALKYSIKGFRVAIREESAFRQELTLAAIMVPIGVFVPVDPVERVLLLGSVMLVLIVELLNSSIENAVDRIGLERNELSGRAKDLGSAAVTVALLTCVMTWGLILVPRFGPALLHWIGVR
ncbi:diacylglycerol kinase [Paraburkholderia eburnea]|uniref:Diacylglycerol kinase n=2 Tax=Paraburkholderia eburnea TaxID=1189126 RepID=A0A2S4MLK7_9BURK|nr:diacylglycerol kinase [Paraburkholderia eburnea]PRZ26792.1 diacylglycerol kinase [Paraburkholderia eburnea]